MEKEKCMEAMDFMKDWDTWRSTIREAISQARNLGLSEETIQQMSEALANFLSEKVCPATPEEELLKEMWDVSTPEERKVLTQIFFKMIEK
ncbi:MAG: DUF3243 family protein [Candidatus Bathyarchaeota archaeon]|jgi:sulfur relay (sulfurtransferase) DsrC/TusE family protein|nr:MAG: DUF3243 family protein [Candidatus Bathyarchaeota archaeon]